MKFTKPESFFAAVILVFGILMVFIIPIGAGADEETHVGRIWEMSSGVLVPNQYLGSGPNYPAAFFLLSYRQDVNLRPLSWEDWKAQFAVKIDWDVMLNYATRARYFPSLYLPQAFLMGIMGRVFDFPVALIYYVERLSYLVLYALAVFLAVRLVPIGKWLLGILATTPMSLIIAASVSPDSTNNGIALIFIAWVFYLNSPEKRAVFSKRDWWITALLTLLVCTLKLNGLPLLLILFMIPRVKFGSRKWLTSFIVVSLFCILVVCLGWNLVTASQLMLSTTVDTYSGVEQIKGILADPLHFLAVVLNNIWTKTPQYVSGWVGISGYDYWTLPAPVFWVMPILVLAALLCEGLGDLLARWKRWFAGAIFALVFLLTLFMFYLLYNPPGSMLLPGVQGRYFIFIVPLLVLALMPTRALLPVKRGWLQAGVVLIMVMTLGALFVDYHLPCGESYYSTGLCQRPRYKNWSPATSISLPITASSRVSQTFVADCNGLTQVRLWVRQKPAEGNLVVSLQSAGVPNSLLTRDVPTTQLPASGWLEITFPKVADSAGQNYTLEISTSNGNDLSAVELGVFNRDEYPIGSLNINKQKQVGDLIFQYGCSVGLDNLLNPVRP